MGDYTLGWSYLHNFSKTAGLTPYLMQFLTLITIRSSKSKFSQKLGGCLHFGSNNSIGSKKCRKVRMITIGILLDPKWCVDSKFGITVQIE